MNFQHYDMLLDKSQKRILYLVEQITPKFTTAEIELYLEEMANNTQKAKKSSKSKRLTKFVNFDNNNAKLADLSKLGSAQLEIIYKTFVSREINNKLTVKWRFYRYYKYIQNLKVRSIKINRAVGSEQIVDFIIETLENEIIFVLCFEILNLEIYDNTLRDLNEFAKKCNITPDRVIFAIYKSYRNIPIDLPLKLNNIEIEPELWLEWTDISRPFKGEDLLIVNKNELKLAGFNFTNIEDLLEYTYKSSIGGQISIFKQINFLSEVVEEEPALELIWKGIMIKKTHS